MADILIIDDEKAIRKTLTEILSYEGYKIEEAGDGEEGFRKFSEKNYDVVLCDIKMPKMDGIEFLEKVKEVNPDVPIIMISGHGNVDTAVEGVKKGADDYISKRPGCVVHWINKAWLPKPKCLNARWAKLWK